MTLTQSYVFNAELLLQSYDLWFEATMMTSTYMFNFILMI